MKKEEIQDEIERKFIMRNMPNIEWHDVIYITQYYVDIDGKPHRIRFSYDCLFEESKGKFRALEFIWKEKVGKGHNKEHHKDISLKEAEALIKKATRCVNKIRFVHKADFKYEVDNFIDIHLVGMEVEVPSLDTFLSIPKKIEEEILTEVTGHPGFDNYNIAVKL